jgi:HEAT repeat protein
MIRRRSLCSLALFAALFTPGVQAQNDAEFQSALDALSRGADEEALEHLKNVLSADLSNEAAYELFQRADHNVWLKLLTRGGEIENVTKELMARSSLGRKERQNNPDAVRELIKQLRSGDAVQRTRTISELAASYGEYAVPILIYSLTDAADADLRVNVMNALTNMGSDVVPPLIEALAAPDASLRRNVALVLGYLGDDRARPSLARLAAGDPDAGVRTAAGKSVAKVGGLGDAGQLFLAQGDAYYREDDAVLLPFQYSDVLWHWEGNGLAFVDVPRFLYAPEMAKKAYYHALELLPDFGPAVAGIARCAVTEIGRLEEWKAAAEEEAAEWTERLRGDDLAAQMAGADSLDLALGWATSQNDLIAAAGLCRLLASSGKAPTENLLRAQASARSASVQGEAAVALGSIAFRNRSAASAETVAALAEAASVEVVRVGALIDSDSSQANAWASRLSTGFNMKVNVWSTGGRGLGAMKAIPGVDLIVISDRLPDLTASQVVTELRSDPRTARTPIFLRATAGDVDEDLYGDKINGVLASGDDLGAVEAALSEGYNRDREEANFLAARAAETLYALAAGGKTDVAPASEALAGALTNRPDEIVAPALGVLQFTGTAAHVARIAAVLSDAAGSDLVRVRAANALAGIFSREGMADAGALETLRAVATGEDSFDVRAATASALGRLNLSREVRVELMQSLLGR